jgi:hypothetical protein
MQPSTLARQKAQLGFETRLFPLQCRLLPQTFYPLTTHPRDLLRSNLSLKWVAWMPGFRCRLPQHPGIQNPRALVRFFVRLFMRGGRLAYVQRVIFSFLVNLAMQLKVGCLADAVEALPGEFSGQVDPQAAWEAPELAGTGLHPRAAYRTELWDLQPFDSYVAHWHALGGQMLLLAFMG